MIDTELTQKRNWLGCFLPIGTSRSDSDRRYRHEESNCSHVPCKEDQNATFSIKEQYER